MVPSNTAKGNSYRGNRRGTRGEPWGTLLSNLSFKEMELDELQIFEINFHKCMNVTSSKSQKINKWQHIWLPENSLFNTAECVPEESEMLRTVKAIVLQCVVQNQTCFSGVFSPQMCHGQVRMFCVTRGTSVEAQQSEKTSFCCRERSHVFDRRLLSFYKIVDWSYRRSLSWCHQLVEWHDHWNVWWCRQTGRPAETVWACVTEHTKTTTTSMKLFQTLISERGTVHLSVTTIGRSGIRMEIIPQGAPKVFDRTPFHYVHLEFAKKMIRALVKKY